MSESDEGSDVGSVQVRARGGRVAPSGRAVRGTPVGTRRKVSSESSSSSGEAGTKVVRRAGGSPSSAAGVVGRRGKVEEVKEERRASAGGSPRSSPGGSPRGKLVVRATPRAETPKARGAAAAAGTPRVATVSVPKMTSPKRAPEQVTADLQQQYTLNACYNWMLAGAPLSIEQIKDGKVSQQKIRSFGSSTYQNVVRACLAHGNDNPDDEEYKKQLSRKDLNIAGRKFTKAEANKSTFQKQYERDNPVKPRPTKEESAMKYVPPEGNWEILRQIDVDNRKTGKSGRTTMTATICSALMKLHPDEFQYTPSKTVNKVQTQKLACWKRPDFVLPYNAGNPLVLS